MKSGKYFEHAGQTIHIDNKLCIIIKKNPNQGLKYNNKNE